MLDKQNRTIQVNKSFERIFGYSQNELRGIHIDEMIIPEVYRKEASDLTLRTSRGKIVQAETIRKRKDGSNVNVAISGIPILLDNKIIGIYGIYEDISERKKTEEALRESEEKFRSIIETTEDAYFEVDLAGNFTFFNIVNPFSVNAFLLSANLISQLYIESI